MQKPVFFIRPFDHLSPNGVAIGNPEWHMRKASHCGSQQQ